MSDAIFQPRGFGQIGPRAFDENFAPAQNGQQRPRSGRCLELVRSRQLRRATRQAGHGGRWALLPGGFRGGREARPRTNREDGWLCNAPQDRDGSGRFIFGCFDDHEALFGKDQAAVTAKNSVANPESQPERAEPGDQKTAQRRWDHRQGRNARGRGQRGDGEHYGYSEYGAFTRSESVMEMLQTAV